MLNENQRYMQRAITRVEQMPNIPTPYKMLNWNQVAQGYDARVFDFNAAGAHFPVIWWDTARRNVNQDIFALPAYVGDNRQNPSHPEEHEGMAAIASVLGATLAGIDKSNQNGQNFVKMTQNYYNADNGYNIFMDSTNHEHGSFWYNLLPGMLYTGLTYYYPNVQDMEYYMQMNADSWYAAASIMNGNGNNANFSHTDFNFLTMQPYDNGTWVEPDSSAGIAWLQYMAYAKWNDPKYLQAAEWGMNYLQRLPEAQNPFFEVLLPYAFYTGARMNAELGKHYDVDKFINWVFDGDTSVRNIPWGVIADHWGNYDVHGLVGGPSIQYAFTMNTFSLSGTVVPAVRYDPRYARSVGKWMLNAANNARLFYPEELPAANQADADVKAEMQNVIAYEGLRKQYGTSPMPYAMGDPRLYGWAQTDFAIYGSGYVGFFGGMIETTNVDKILRIDTLKTDFFRQAAYPTYLYYNPHGTAQTVQLDVGTSPVDLYDSVNKTFVQTNVSGTAAFQIPADSAVVLTLAPANGTVTYDGKKMLINNVVVDYNRLLRCPSCAAAP